jgi:hypothetical protein
LEMSEEKKKPFHKGFVYYNICVSTSGRNT